jgi:hypothetical protein
MVVLSGLYDIGDPPDIANLQDIVHDVNYYFAIFRDSANRKLVAVRRASQFKVTLASQNRLVSIYDNTLRIIQQKVLRLDRNFDLLICNTNIYIGDVRAIESLADLVEVVADAAHAKLHRISEAIPFLDLTGIANTIENHPRTARLATAIAARGDLAIFDRAKIENLANAQGIVLHVTPEGKLKPKVSDQHKLLEILDDRRYLSNLTTAEPVPYRAPSRQRVKPE